MEEIKTDDSVNQKNPGSKGQWISIIVLVLIMIAFWNMIDLVILTFIITFLLYAIVGRLQRQFQKISRHGLPAVLVLALVYVLFIAVLALISVSMIPKVMQQFTELSNFVMNFDFAEFQKALDPRISALIDNVDVAHYISIMSGVISSAAAKIGQFSLNLFFALVLSFFLVVEKDKIKEFGGRLENSRISFMYGYFVYFGGIFTKTFGSVMKVQVTIAFINAVISSVVLFFMGFPSVIGIGVMMFCFGLIPVAGVVISLIPLCTIAFTIGGLTKVFEVIAMVIVIHAIEAYILNPKLMANRVRLPVCFVFIILLVAEHCLKVWGLLIGVPMFIFLMTVLDVDYAIEKKKKRGGDD